jgi:hypothetical protein
LSVLAARDMTTAGPGVVAQAVLGAALLAAATAVLWRRPAALTAWAAGAGVILAFIYLKYFGALRHHGHLWLLLTALLWLAPTVRPRPRVAPSSAPPSSPPPPPPPLARPLVAGVWTTLLAVQLAGGVYAAYAEMTLPFSASRDAAAFVQSTFNPATPVVVDPRWIGTPIAGCLRRPVVFAQTERPGTFVVWDDTMPIDYPVAQRVALTAATGGPTGEAALLTNYLLPPNDPRFELLEQFPASVVPDEVYVVYRVRPPRAAAAAP